MARVSLDPPRTIFFRVMEWYSRRTYGKVLDPGKALAHNPRVLWATCASSSPSPSGTGWTPT
ncbi:hypothetical protein [Streptomyces mutabilis]|uniref:hypothetical protein n=1 Tax=Streptomyces mutabilis TaxID=67332 RepID=UPI003435D6F5